MIIKTLCNFKMNNGRLWLKGIYDDANEPFPKELYDEIERSVKDAKKGILRKKKLEILNKTPRQSPASLESIPEEINTLDSEDDVIETSDDAEDIDVTENAETEVEEIKEIEEVKKPKSRKRKK